MCSRADLKLFLAASAIALGALSLVGCDRNSTSAAVSSATNASKQEQPAVTGTSAAALGVKEHPGPLDSVPTAAGQISVAEVKSKDGMVTKTLSLSGKTIYDQNDYRLSIERAFDFPDKRTVLLLAVSDGGTACPSEYRFITIHANGSNNSTDKFGTCSDEPTITVSDDKITVGLPDMQGRGNEAWAYANGGLSKARSLDASLERNAHRLTFAEDAPTKVRGTLAQGQGVSPDWILRLPQPTKLDGGAGSFCASIVDSLPISLAGGEQIPKSDGENDFIVTIACPRSGAVVSAIRLPGVTPTPQKQQVRTGQIYVNAGATICADMYSMNKARAIAAANNPYAQLPEGCVVMQNAVKTRILRDDTPIPGVVIIEAGRTAAMADRNDLSIR